MAAATSNNTAIVRRALEYHAMGPALILPKERPLPDNGIETPVPRRHRLKRVPVRPNV